MSTESRVSGFRRSMAFGVAAILGVMAFWMPPSAQAARIYNMLPFAIYVCPLRVASPLVEGWNNRDYNDKTKFPDSNVWAISDPTGFGAVTRSGDPCYFLDAGSEANPVRSPSLEWKSAVQLNVRMAFSPSASYRADSRCILKLDSHLAAGETFGHDFQGGNYVLLKFGTNVIGKQAIRGTIYNASHAVLKDVVGNESKLHCPDM